MPEARPRLLLVDDEPDIREVFARYLRLTGWEVVTADNAEDALSLAARESFTAVLLDNVLTGATGMMALPKLVKLTKAPILLMTGYTDDEFDGDAKLLGARAVLRKPMEPSDVDRALREAAGL